MELTQFIVARRELMYSIGRMYTLEQSRMGSFATTIDINKLEQ